MVGSLNFDMGKNTENTLVSVDTIALHPEVGREFLGFNGRK
jgi:hypothetical protein